MIAENEAKYGQEARERYGDEQVDASNAKLMGLSEEAFERAQRLAVDICASLEAAVQAGLPPEGAEGQRIAQAHREWITLCWPAYDPQAHAGLVRMYLDDPRFTAYYDGKQPGCAQFLHDAVLHLLG